MLSWTNSITGGELFIPLWNTGIKDLKPDIYFCGILVLEFESFYTWYKKT